MKNIISLVFLLFMAMPVFAEVQTTTFEYKDGDTVLEGFVAYNDAIPGQQPGVLVVHDWMGFGPFANHKAEELAKLGYTAMAVDIFGKNVRPKSTEEASAQASLYKGDRDLLRRRISAAFDELRKMETVDPKKIAVMGFCFGGTVALELARSAAPVAGAVSFHGSLNTPAPKDAENIKAKILVLHGADDPYVPAEEVQAFEKEMNDAKVDWELVKYSGAVHSFTNPNAGTDNSKGQAYNVNADRRSWAAMKSFFEEIFK